MPARRRKTLGKKLTAQAASEGMTEADEKITEESRPAVTQVVEVIEEDVIPITEQPTPSSVSQESAEKPVEEPVEEETESETPVSVPREPEVPTSSSRKSMVEELYGTQRKSSVMPEISMHRNGSKKSLLVWAIVTIIVALLTGGILYTVSRKGSMPSILARPTPTPTSAPTAAPTPTPAAVDKASFEIQVMNGGGTPGAAGKMKTFLEDKGYKVSGTGNTDSYTYDTTEIHGKSTMSDAVANLKTDLKDSYTLGIVATDLDASASADVQVIVGKE